VDVYHGNDNLGNNSKVCTAYPRPLDDTPGLTGVSILALGK